MGIKVASEGCSGNKQPPPSLPEFGELWVELYVSSVVTVTMVSAVAVASLSSITLSLTV